MKKQRCHYEKPRRSKRPMLLLAIVVLAGASFGIAMAWQGMEDAAKSAAESESIPSVPEVESSSSEEVRPLVEDPVSEASSTPVVSSAS